MARTEAVIAAGHFQLGHLVILLDRNGLCIDGHTEDIMGIEPVHTIDLDNGVMVDGATVVAADIEATNGVIHVIDQVILPQG